MSETVQDSDIVTMGNLWEIVSNSVVTYNFERPRLLLFDYKIDRHRTRHDLFAIAGILADFSHVSVHVRYIVVVFLPRDAL